MVLSNARSNSESNRLLQSAGRTTKWYSHGDTTREMMSNFCPKHVIPPLTILVVLFIPVPIASWLQASKVPHQVLTVIQLLSQTKFHSGLIPKKARRTGAFFSLCTCEKRESKHVYCSSGLSENQWWSRPPPMTKSCLLHALCMPLDFRNVRPLRIKVKG